MTLVKSNPGKIRTEDIELVYKYAGAIASKEYLGGLIQAVILFGSVSRGESKEESDIDLLVLINDADNEITTEIASTYSLVSGSLLVKLNAQGRIHLTTLGVMRFWDGVRMGDPVIMSLLRTGKPIVDTGFVTPLKKLLEKGMIKPTQESIDAHLSMARKLVNTTGVHIVASVSDLYWACMDTFHSYVMSLGLLTVAPLEAPVLMAKLAKKNRIPLKYVESLKEFVAIMKSVTHGKKKGFTGVEYDALKVKAENFVSYMGSLVKGKI